MGSLVICVCGEEMVMALNRPTALAWFCLECGRLEVAALGNSDRAIVMKDLRQGRRPPELFFVTEAGRLVSIKGKPIAFLGDESKIRGKTSTNGTAGLQSNSS